MKTPETIRIEEALLKQFTDMGQTSVAEVTIGYYGNEICDVMRYETNGDFTCFEIKVSVSDFRSKNKLSFHGHKNYFVLTPDVYEKVKEEIPKDIGVYLAKEIYDHKYDYEKRAVAEVEPRRVTGVLLECAKKCRRRELEVAPDQLLAYMLRSSFNATNYQRRGFIHKKILLWSLKETLAGYFDDEDIKKIQSLVSKGIFREEGQ